MKTLLVVICMIALINSACFSQRQRYRDRRSCRNNRYPYDSCHRDRQTTRTRTNSCNHPIKVNTCTPCDPYSVLQNLQNARSCSHGRCDTPMCLNEAKSRCPTIDIDTLITPEFTRKVDKLRKKYGDKTYLDLLVVDDTKDNTVDS